MKIIKVSEATNIQLDWLVCRAGGGGKLPIWHWIDGRSIRGMFCYTTDPTQMYPVIEREAMALWPDAEGGYFASADEGRGSEHKGSTLLIAAARCYVALKLGEEVGIPKELT